MPAVLRHQEYRIWDTTGFTSIERDTSVPPYLSVIEPGGAIHLHTDRGWPQGNLNVRFNLMVAKPIGGEPEIDGEIVDVSTGDGWMFDATNYKHRSQSVKDGWRIVISFGFQIPAADGRLAKLGICGA